LQQKIHEQYNAWEYLEKAGGLTAAFTLIAGVKSMCRITGKSVRPGLWKYGKCRDSTLLE